ncbi:MraZ protein [Desulfacinum infernum DSM 9756]|uniref:Transcriptional regulator MraZ n=1 Tax=Desulfacinum infernum DSM 9756 TaxID=1121391 RepID=A0A1M5H606_9BACT|nr:division/cell wall cluster transcriptional repressor MraZ [Desulfacinum infernum]SHG11429.1 MraZ protein [Desulfacinum infernum DSM 9756]
MGILKSKRFRGQSIHRLDDKGRLRIPTKFREILQECYTDGLVLAMRKDHLEAYPPEEWEQIEDKLLRKVALNKDVREFVRYFVSSAVECEFDKQGRILIPALHRERAGINQEVVLVGVLDSFEIWDTNRWHKGLEAAGARYDQTFSEVARHLD